MSREFDIVVMGASGFTGSLVVEYFAKTKIPNIKLALAGRSASKIKEVCESVKQKFPDFQVPPIIIADSSDSNELELLAQRTKVVLTTVGPYARYGTKLVEACVKHSTHYCDLTGEVPWVKSIIDKYDAEAQKNHSLIVPCSGFDSIPSDLGVFILQDYVSKNCPEYSLAKVKYVLMKVKGGASGGTIESALNLFDTYPVEELKKSNNPYYLCSNSKDQVRHTGQFSIEFDSDANRWTFPFVMASVNTKVVHRSNYLLGNCYGRDFQYRERSSSRNLFLVLLQSFALTLFFLLASITFTRNYLLRKVVPKPGEGPDEKTRNTGLFEVNIYAELSPRDLPAQAVDAGSSLKKKKLMAVVKGIADPGYGETSKMIAETAVCLSLPREQVNSKLHGGIVTPASALGMTLVERLRLAGMTFTVCEITP